MTKFIQWLSDHRWYNILLLIAYYLLVVLPHEQVGLFATWLFSSFSREQYNLIILILSICFAVSIGIFTVKKITLHPERYRVIFFSLISLVLIAYSFQVLFVVNIEAIHFIQYGIFAILCFPLVRHYTRTLIWATLAGAVDEGYQFFFSGAGENSAFRLERYHRQFNWSSDRTYYFENLSDTGREIWIFHTALSFILHLVVIGYGFFCATWHRYPQHCAGSRRSNTSDSCKGVAIFLLDHPSKTLC